MSDDDILSEDLYGLLGVEETAELKDIQKAPRSFLFIVDPCLVLQFA